MWGVINDHCKMCLKFRFLFHPFLNVFDYRQCVNSVILEVVEHVNFDRRMYAFLLFAYVKLVLLQ